MNKLEIIYLATPYIHPDPAIVELRFKQACVIAGKLMQQGKIVFCPIAHTHPIAVVCPEMPQFDYEYWLKFDQAFIGVSKKLLIVPLMGWKESKGIAKEITIARELKIPVDIMSIVEMRGYLRS